MRPAYAPDGLHAQNRLPTNQDVPSIPAGDTVCLALHVTWAGDPPTSTNTILEFVLSDTRIDGGEEAHVTLGWQHGLSVTETPQGLVLQVPLSSGITGELRRGSYAYAAVLSSMDKTRRHTVATGNIMIDYTPASSHRDISYR